MANYKKISETILGLSNPWPLVNVLEKLIEGTETLLLKHSYDGHGYEELNTCVKRGREIISEIKSLESEPEERKMAEEILRKWLTKDNLGVILTDGDRIYHAMEEYANQSQSPQLTDEEIGKLSIELTKDTLTKQYGDKLDGGVIVNNGSLVSLRNGIIIGLKAYRDGLIKPTKP